MPNIGRDPEITKNEIEAGRRGGEAAQAASDSIDKTYESGEKNATQMASVFGSAEAQGEQNKETRRSNQMREAQTSDQQDIEMADRGLEQQGPSRADRLRQEMERGRQDEQMGKPLEVQGPDSKTGSVQQTEQRKSLDTEKMAAAKLNSQAHMLEAQKRLQDAKIKGDTVAEKAAINDLHEPIVSAAKLYDEGKNPTKGLDDAQWNQLSGLATIEGKANPDPSLQQEIQAKRFGPAVSRFLQSHLNFQALKFTAGTGHLPDGKLVDMASPEWQAFGTTAGAVQSWLAMSDAMTGGLTSFGMKINSIADKNAVINRMSATAMLEGMKPLTPQGGSNPVPSQGGASARPQQPGSGAEGSPPPDIRRKPKLGAPGSNANAGTDEQQLQEREQRGVDFQQSVDERRRGPGGRDDTGGGLPGKSTGQKQRAY
jgi:hypothetical protein